MPALRRGAREPSRAAGRVRPLRRRAARAHGAASADPRAHAGAVDDGEPRRRRDRGWPGPLPGRDLGSLGGVFSTRRWVGGSRRGLRRWEEDGYRRWSRIPWGETTLLYPFGPPTVGQRRVVWVEITVSRGFAAGETRASEEVTVMDSSIAFSAQAVIPPRRVTVRMWLVRGDTASSRQAMDLVPETTGRRVSFRLGREKLDFDVALERTEAPRTGRDSALAVGVDVVCLRVVAPESPESARVRCGRLDDIARRVALVGGDTLMATFGWPPAR